MGNKDMKMGDRCSIWTTFRFHIVIPSAYKGNSKQSRNWRQVFNLPGVCLCGSKGGWRWPSCARMPSSNQIDHLSRKSLLIIYVFEQVFWVPKCCSLSNLGISDLSSNFPSTMETYNYDFWLLQKLKIGHRCCIFSYTGQRKVPKHGCSMKNCKCQRMLQQSRPVMEQVCLSRWTATWRWPG